MKHILSFFFALAFAFSSMSQTNTDWKIDKLKGKVKSFVLLENYRYKKDGKFTEWGILYNKKTSFDNTGRYTEYTELTTTGTLYYKIKYAYNTKDKKTTISYFDKDEKPTIKKLWYYNSKGELTEMQEYTKDNKPDWRYIYTYDTKGNRVMLESYKPDSTLYSKTLWTYDVDGNEIFYLLKTAGYANSSRKSAYDDKGNKIEEQSLNGKNEVDYRSVNTYDEKGNIIEEVKYKGMDKRLYSSTWKYEYDSKGNWIKRTQYNGDGIEFDIAERTISYY